VRALEALAGFGEPGPRVTSSRTLPAIVLDPHTPKSLVREFLAGLFGGDGVAPTIVHLDRAPHTMKAVRFVQSRTDSAVLQRLLDEVRSILARFGVDALAQRLIVPPPGSGTYATAVRTAPRWCGAIEVLNGLAFAERIGFRYCAHKSARLSAAAAWWRMK